MQNSIAKIYSLKIVISRLKFSLTGSILSMATNRYLLEMLTREFTFSLLQEVI